MKISKENALLVRGKLSAIQKELEETRNLIDLMATDLTDAERHNLKALSKARGWISNLKSDVKRSAKNDRTNI